MHIPTSQLRDGHVFLALQIGHLPLLAGEQQYLAPLAFLQQIVQRCVEPFVIEGHQRVIQNEGHPLVGGQHHVADGQPHRQIQLVGGALTQQADAATHRVAGGHSARR